MPGTDEQEEDCGLSDRIEAAIARGVQQGRMHLDRRRKQFRRRAAGAMAASIIMLTLLITVRVSPAFAAILREIPGLERFVDLISHSGDKGLQLALGNEFIQSVGKSDEHAGMKLTVQGILADDSRMVVFYDIQVTGENEIVRLDSPRLTDTSGKSLPVTLSLFNFPDEANPDTRKTGIQRGTIDIQLGQGTALPDEVVLKMKLQKPVQTDKEETFVSGGTEFQVSIPIDHARFAGLRQEYAIGQTIQFEGQSVTFAKAVVSPLSVALYMDYDKDNIMQIFGAGDIRLVDDKGAVWRNISASLEKDHPVYRFESPYFQRPKSLTIEGSWFRALDKNRMTVTVDTENGRLIQAPDGKLAIDTITKKDNAKALDFVLSAIEQEDNNMYAMFEGEFRDAAGKRYTSAKLSSVIAGYINNSERGKQHSMYYIEDIPYKQPLTFTLQDYPAYIRKPYQIRIK